MADAGQFELGTIILAAGRSSRMGRPKMLLPWGQNTVLGHLVAVWRQLGSAQTAVVCAPDDAAVAGELDRIGFSTDARIINPRPDRGMFSSIQCAAQWSGWKNTLSHWAIALGDQPHLQPATLDAVLQFARDNREKICQPSRRGRPRHPVIVPKAILEELARSTAWDLKEFLRSLSAAPQLLESDDPGLDLDIDRPEDYQTALDLWRKDF
ncbi:MAG TPA: nucleotidyltransferase family protein [Gemmataceae bacterium]|nr:nucleotidyltransferase family protein [Gemmataceae bacterium]